MHTQREPTSMASPAAKGLSAALPLGTQLSCTTTYGDTLRGNVIATDETTRAVVIREGDTPTSSGAVHVINLRHVSKMEVIGPPKPGAWPSDSASLPEINLQKVQRRLEENLRTRWREISSKGVNVSDDAQQLFDTLRKMYDDIHWEGSTIVVLNDVRISPPYNPESCTGSKNSIQRIQKLVTKFHEEQKTQTPPPATSLDQLN